MENEKYQKKQWYGGRQNIKYKKNPPEIFVL
jgi:hypothetical protein